MPDFKIDTDNIEAVKAAYIDGSLEIRPGYWTFWVAGRQKCSYINNPTAIGPAPHEVFQRWIEEAFGPLTDEVFQRWTEENNGHRVWMEHPVCSHLFARLYSQNTN
jgi:hypothetical protein